MSKRNIAIALFDPECNVRNSNWPRFTGWKEVGNPYIESGLFGLVDRSIRMHRFFKNTDIKTVLNSLVRYKKRGIDVISSCRSIEFKADGTGMVIMPVARQPDTSIKWLTPYVYVQEDGIEWDVYPIVTGADIFINGDFHRIYKTEGYWDMSIWRPSDEQITSDIYRIEQCTINHVVALGHPAMVPITYNDKSPDYDKYKEVNVTREIPDFS